MSHYARFFLVLILLYLGNPTLDAQSINTWKSQLSSSDIELRINALLELNKAYNQTLLDSAALYGQSALENANQLGKDSLVGVAHSQLCLTYYYQRQLDSMLHHAQAGKAAALSAGADMLRAYCLKMESLSYSYLEDFEAAKRSNEDALSIYQEQRDTARMAGIYSNQGRLYQRQAVYDEALAEFIKAQQLFAQQKDADGESITAAQIGDLLLDMERPSEAVSYLHRSLTLTDTVQSPIRHGDLLIALGSAYSADSMDLDSAYLYFEASRVRFAQINDLQGLAIAHNNLGNVLLQQNQYKRAYSHLHQSRAIATANNWPSQIAFNAKNLGLYHQKNEQQDSAIHYFLQAYNLSQEYELAFAEEAILLSLYEHYKQTGQAVQALAIYEQYQSLREATKNESVQKEIAALQTAYETEQKEQRIARLELESALQQSRSRTYFLGFTALSSALLLIVGLLYYRRRKDREMFELRQTVLKQDKEKLDQELQYKTKQLTSHALHMVQKNKVLQELRMGISDLVKGADATQKKALRSLVRRIDFNIQADEDWQTFRLYFEQTNQNFYKKLAEINSDLTTTDLKLCSLIKLNLNIKETAAVLNIEPTSVKTARHRLRKKLRLEPGQDLTSFIRQVA